MYCTCVLLQLLGEESSGLQESIVPVTAPSLTKGVKDDSRGYISWCAYIYAVINCAYFCN